MQAMRIVFILSLLIPFLGTSHGQNIDKFYKWDISVSYSLQEHDKRLYDYPKFPQQRILENQPERWGSHWYKIVLHHNLLESKDFKLKAGIGYATEYRTFERPFDHCLWLASDGICPNIGQWTKGYKIKSINIPVEYSYNLIGGLNVNATTEGNFSFYRNPQSNVDWYDYKLYELAIYSFTLYPGVSYDFGRFLIKADYRAFQLKNIDDIIFYDSLFKYGPTPDPRENGMFETYNPMHFRITLSYEFGERTFEEE